MRAPLTIFLIVALCSVSVLCGQTCSSNPFGVASGFNLFVLQTIDGCSSDVEGKVAGGTNVHLRNYLIGDRLPYTEEYALISGGPISFHNGGVVHGGILGQSVTDIDNVHISVSGTVVDAEVCCPDSTCGYCTAGSSPIDFAAARTELRGLSDLWGSWDTTNGAIYTDEFGNINLHCVAATTLNVFTGVSVTADNNEININCAAGQTVLINYTPATAGFPSSFGVNLRGGVTAATVIHHFVNPSISLTSAVGAVFAPYSSLAFPNGLITGDVVVDNFDTPSSCNGGQINYAPFTGCIPVNSDEFYCCLYERNEFTRTYCTDLPCSYVAFPQWDFVGEYEVDSCRNCCFTYE